MYIKGNFFFVIKKILNKYKSKKIALLVDGPKGLFAHSYCYNLIYNYKNLKLVFFDNILKNKFNIFIFLLFKRINCFEDLKLSSEIKKKLIFFNNKNRSNRTSDDNDFGFLYAEDLRLNYFSFF